MNTNLLKTLSLMIIFIAPIASVCAQKTFHQSAIEKKWRNNDKNEPTYWVLEYTNTGKIIGYMDIKPVSEWDYYLSNSGLEKEFNKSKVDKNTKGKFLIFHNKYSKDDMMIFRILSLTDDRLILKYDSGDIWIFKSNKNSVLLTEFCDKTTLDYEKFTKKTFQKKDIANKKWFKECPDFTVKSEANYYLSDTVETVFDESKIGKSTSGRYIIERSSWDGEIFVFEILELTDSKLKLKSCHRHLNIKKDEIFIYQAVED